MAQLPPQVWEAMKEASVKASIHRSQLSQTLFIPSDMDDLFLVPILGKCGQGLLGGAGDKSWLLEQRHSGFLIQDSKHSQLDQVIYDSLFPDNPRAIRSLDIEDWDAFCSPWAHDRYLKGK